MRFKVFALSFFLFSCGVAHYPQVEEFSYRREGNNVIFSGTVISDISDSRPAEVDFSYEAKGGRRVGFPSFWCYVSSCEVRIVCTLTSVDYTNLLVCDYPDGNVRAMEVRSGEVYTFYLRACKGGVCDEKGVEVFF